MSKSYDFDSIGWKMYAFLMVFGNLLIILGVGAIYWIIGFNWPGVIQSSLHELLHPPGESVVGALTSMWFVFLFVFLVNVAIQAIYRNKPNTTPLKDFIKGKSIVYLIVSTSEEIIFRWLAFGIGTAVFVGINHLSDGGLQSFYAEHIVPALNVATFGVFEPQLTGESAAYGLSFVVTAILFGIAHIGKTPHVWLGILRPINATVLGLAFFYAAFNYGLLAAIVLHILCNCIAGSLGVLSYTWSPHDPTKSADQKAKEMVLQSE